MKQNTSDIALIFEGGAMRNAYTAAVVKVLLDNGIVFPKAYGISAGAVLAAGYVANDVEWSRAIFTDAVLNPKAGGAKALFEGKGFFDLQYILEGLSEINASNNSEWAFDMNAFRNGETDIHIEAFDRETGETIAWTRADMLELTDVMERVAASCSYPLFTPATEIDGRFYIDGGMGTSHGICLDAARRDGFKRFFIVRTQPRHYRMNNISFEKKLAYKTAYAKYPKVYKALCDRPKEYNHLLDELEILHDEGTAYVFCPDTMPITYKTVEYEKLVDAYNMGIAQCQKELTSWLKWIEG